MKEEEAINLIKEVQRTWRDPLKKRTSRKELEEQIGSRKTRKLMKWRVQAKGKEALLELKSLGGVEYAEFIPPIERKIADVEIESSTEAKAVLRECVREAEQLKRRGRLWTIISFVAGLVAGRYILPYVEIMMRWVLLNIFGLFGQI